jgi:hypothetical protein
LLWPQVQDGATHLEQILCDVFALPLELPGLRVDVQRPLLLVEQGFHFDRLFRKKLFINEMQLIEDVDQVDLIGLFDLLLDDLAELGVELLGQVSVRFVIHYLLYTTVGRQLRFTLGLVLLDVLFPLLVYRLLVQHVERAVFVARAHELRPVVDLWREEALAGSAVLRLALAEYLA